MVAGKRVVRRAGVIGLCAGAALAASSARAAQVTANWLAPVSGSWTDATKWSGGQFPNNGNPAGTTYHAVIDAVGGPYTVTLSQAATVDDLVLSSADATLSHTAGTMSLFGASSIQAGRYSLSGGTVDGAGDLSIASMVDWSSGTVQGDGRVLVEQTGVLRWLNAGPKHLARDLHNYGVISDSRGDVFLEAGVEIRNYGLFDLNTAHALRFKRSGEGTATVINDGVVRASQNVNTYFEEGVAFLNQGLFETTSTFDGFRFLGGLSNVGEIRVGGGSFWVVSLFHNDGLVQILETGLLRLGRTVTHGDNSVFTGAGNLEFHSEEHQLSSQFAGCTGRITVSSGTLHVYSHVQPSDWKLTGGVTHFHDDRVIPAGSSVAGGDVSGEGRLWFESLDWGGGALQTGGVAEILEGGQMRVIGNATLARELRNLGVMEIDDRTLTITSGSLFNAGSLILHEDASIVGVGPLSALVNQGLMTASGGRIVNVSGADLLFQNDGVIEIESGTTLRLSTDILPGALGVIDGDGLLDFAGGHATVKADEIGVQCAVAVSGGAVTFEETPNVALWSFTAGSAVFQSAFHGGSLLRTSGTALRFESGLTLAADSTIETSGLGSIDFTNSDVVVSALRLEGGALLGESDVLATGLFRWTGGTMGGGGRTIVGESATAQLGGFGAMSVARELVIEGAATWGNTLFRFDGGVLRNVGTLTTHHFQGTPGRMQALAGGGVLINDGTIVKNGDGEMLLAQNGGVMSFQNTGLLDVREGLVRLEGEAVTTNEGTYAMAHAGSVHVGGDFVNASAASLSFEVGGVKERGLSGLMTITGEASLAGTLSVETPEAFEATWGDRWVVMTYGSVEGDFDVLDLPTEGFVSRSDDFGASDLRWYAERGETEYAVGVSHAADIDHDGLIGFGDLNMIASNFNAFGSWAQGDVDGDGFVGFTDLNAVLSLFNVAAPRSVPAPGAVVVFGLAAGVSLRRKRA